MNDMKIWIEKVLNRLDETDMNYALVAKEFDLPLSKVHEIDTLYGEVDEFESHRYRY